MPRFIIMILIVLGLSALVPLAVIYKARFNRSEDPRVHFVWHMDNMGRFKAQQAHPFFEDGRAMRPTVEGTIARVDSEQPDYSDEGHDAFHHGLIDASLGVTEGDTSNFVTAIPMSAFPVVVDQEREIKLSDGVREPSTEWLDRGRERYGIYCSPCHGLTGDGQGLIHKRAIALVEAGTMQPTWTQPVILYADNVVEMPEGQLFHTITHGVRNMKGYGAQIAPEDRWAIVAWVRVLQRAARATADDIASLSAEQRTELDRLEKDWLSGQVARIRAAQAEGKEASEEDRELLDRWEKLGR